MARKLKIAALALFIACGVWLAFQPGALTPDIHSAWSCAASRAIICVQKGR
jgi:hypothetical protein